MKDHSGQVSKLYVYEEALVQIAPCFIYEVCVYKYWKSGFCLLGSKFIKSNHLLTIKHHNIYKKYLGYFIEKEIYLVGVPKEFVLKNNLTEYTPIVKLKKHKRK